MGSEMGKKEKRKMEEQKVGKSRGEVFLFSRKKKKKKKPDSRTRTRKKKKDLSLPLTTGNTSILISSVIRSPPGKYSITKCSLFSSWKEARRATT